MRYKGAKGKAWLAASSYVKKRDNYTCFTCGKTNLFGKDAQAGHYRTVASVGSNNKRCWDERFIAAQCSRCNGTGAGEQAIYRSKLVETYGEEIVAEFDANYRRVDAIKNWQEVIERYKKLEAEL